MPRKRKQKSQRVWEQPAGRKRGSKLGLAFLGIAMISGLLYWTSRSVEQPRQMPASPAGEPVSQQPANIPPFFESEQAAKPFPPTLSPASFIDRRVSQAYQIAREIPGVLAQQPCYCYCDKFGHRALLDCFRNNHGAG
ncbi:MAG: hypothetical protein LC130_26945 [Bryobacterales bacterium]|nr:hypothetical protein [Bryobacterales bacterium]